MVSPRLLLLASVLTVVAPPRPLANDSQGPRVDEDYLFAFPEAGEGMDRCVVFLPKKSLAEEADRRVELIVGKRIATDGVNRFSLDGELKAKTVKGWGFAYYQLSEFGRTVSTAMGVPPGTPPVEKFVSIPTKLVDYNSRVPLVVYVPKGGQVRYRIWTASDKTEVAERG